MEFHCVIAPNRRSTPPLVITTRSAINIKGLVNEPIRHYVRSYAIKYFTTTLLKANIILKHFGSW